MAALFLGSGSILRQSCFCSIVQQFVDFRLKPKRKPKFSLSSAQIEAKKTLNPKK